MDQRGFSNHTYTMKKITALLNEGVVLGDGGYLIELERRGYVDSGSRREKVGTGKGSGQFTPEVAVQHPDALRELYREFLNAGLQVLQALTLVGTRGVTGTVASSLLPYLGQPWDSGAPATLEQIASGPALVARFNQVHGQARSGQEVGAAAAAWKKFS